MHSTPEMLSVNSSFIDLGDRFQVPDVVSHAGGATTKGMYVLRSSLRRHKFGRIRTQWHWQQPTSPAALACESAHSLPNKPSWSCALRMVSEPAVFAVPLPEFCD